MITHSKVVIYKLHKKIQYFSDNDNEKVTALIIFRILIYKINNK